MLRAGEAPWSLAIAGWGGIVAIYRKQRGDLSIPMVHFEFQEVGHVSAKKTDRLYNHDLYEMTKTLKQVSSEVSLLYMYNGHKIRNNN